VSRRESFLHRDNRNEAEIHTRGSVSSASLISSSAIEEEDGANERPGSGLSWSRGLTNTPPDTPTRHSTQKQRETESTSAAAAAATNEEASHAQESTLVTRGDDVSSSKGNDHGTATGATSTARTMGSTASNTLATRKSRNSPAAHAGTRDSGGSAVKSSTRRKGGPVWEELGHLEPEPYDTRGSRMHRLGLSHRTVQDHTRLPARPRSLPKLSPDRMAHINKLATPKSKPDPEPSRVDEEPVVIATRHRKVTAQQSRRLFDPTE
jgi:hypothetical protein